MVMPLVLSSGALQGQSPSSALQTRTDSLACEQFASRFLPANLFCGLQLNQTASQLCEVSGIKLHRHASIIRVRTMFWLRDSSVLVSAAPPDASAPDSSVRDDGFMQVDSCKSSIREVTREWRYRTRTEAIQLFRELLTTLQSTTQHEFVNCVVEPTSREATDIDISATSFQADRATIALISVGEQKPKLKGNFVSVYTFPSSGPLLLRNGQREVTCTAALRLLTVGTE
jgi:hypothetical protein